MNWTLQRYIENIVENIFRSNFSYFPLYFLPVVRFSCLGRDQIFTSSKRLFEISEFEIARVNCIYGFWYFGTMYMLLYPINILMP